MPVVRFLGVWNRVKSLKCLDRHVRLRPRVIPGWQSLGARSEIVPGWFICADTLKIAGIGPISTSVRISHN